MSEDVVIEQTCKIQKRLPAGASPFSRIDRSCGRSAIGTVTQWGKAVPACAFHISVEKRVEKNRARERRGWERAQKEREEESKARTTIAERFGLRATWTARDLLAKLEEAPTP